MKLNDSGKFLFEFSHTHFQQIQLYSSQNTITSSFTLMKCFYMTSYEKKSF